MHRHTLFRVLIVGTCLLATGCGSLSPPPGSWHATVEGVDVYYVVRDGGLPNKVLGRSEFHPGWCLVEISAAVVAEGYTFHVPIVAHEVGHCLDRYVLRWTHGGFTTEGCAWGHDYCQPSQAYAEAFARLYLAACGQNSYALGWSDEGEPCEVPDPKSVTPDST